MTQDEQEALFLDLHRRIKEQLMAPPYYFTRYAHELEALEASFREIARLATAAATLAKERALEARIAFPAPGWE